MFDLGLASVNLIGILSEYINLDIWSLEKKYEYHNGSFSMLNRSETPCDLNLILHADELVFQE